MPASDLSATVILGTRVDHTSYADAARRIVDRARAGAGGYVCAANVHMVMEAWDSPSFGEIVNRAALVTSDGMPLVWTIRARGRRAQARVYGPTLTLWVCELAAREGVAVGFLGGTPDVLARLHDRLSQSYPSLKVTFSESPPFRPLSPEEDAALVGRIAASGAAILFVGLGCPKQERWMGEHAGRVGAVMLGVGAAFDFHAGVKPQAPGWMQRLGLEWLFRLVSEPGRLWRRYLVNNPRFILLTLGETLGLRLKRS